MSWRNCPYAAGRKHIAKLLADRRRVVFVNKLSQCEDIFVMKLTEAQQNFVGRIIEETTGKHIPDLHSGDCNIIDSLRRKYEGKINTLAQPPTSPATTMQNRSHSIGAGHRPITAPASLSGADTFNDKTKDTL